MKGNRLQGETVLALGDSLRRGSQGVLIGLPIVFNAYLPDPDSGLSASH